jgi:hypothetical protein
VIHGTCAEGAQLRQFNMATRVEMGTLVSLGNPTNDLGVGGGGFWGHGNCHDVHNEGATLHREGCVVHTAQQNLKHSQNLWFEIVEPCTINTRFYACVLCMRDGQTLSQGVTDFSTVKRTMFTNRTPVKSPLHVVGFLC